MPFFLGWSAWSWAFGVQRLAFGQASVAPPFYFSLFIFHFSLSGRKPLSDRKGSLRAFAP
jgi:hypothetical protein